jgi:hypothetical protein
MGREIFSKDKKQILWEAEDRIRTIQGEVVDTKVADQFLKDLEDKSDGTFSSILSGVGSLGSDSKEYELLIQRGDRLIKVKVRRSLLKQVGLRLRWVPSDSLL